MKAECAQDHNGKFCMWRHLLHSQIIEAFSLAPSDSHRSIVVVQDEVGSVTGEDISLTVFVSTAPEGGTCFPVCFW